MIPLLFVATALADTCPPDVEPNLHFEWGTDCLAITTPLEQPETPTSDATGAPLFEREMTVREEERFVVDLTNLCEGDIELVQDDCDEEVCPLDGVIPPGTTYQVSFPVLLEGNGAVYEAQVFMDDVGSSLVVENDGGETMDCGSGGGLFGCQTSRWPTSPLAWLARR